MKQTPSTRLTTRRIIATAKQTREGIDALGYAHTRWAGDSPVTSKGIGDSAMLDWSVSARLTNLFDPVIQENVPGRVGLRRLPFEVPLLAPDDQLAASWTAQSQAIKVSRMSLARDTLERRKLAAITVVTNEALEANSQRVETALESSFRAAMGLALDAAFLSTTNTGSDSTPASVTHNAPQVASSGDPFVDLPAVLAVHPGDLPRSVWVTDPLTATELALRRDTSGGIMFPDLGPNGGSLLGLPLLTSRGSPRDSSGGVIALIDGSGIAMADDGLEVLASDETLVEMEDVTPTGASDTPTAASATPVLLYQVGCTAFRFTMHVNWAIQRPSVACITGAAY